MLAACGFRLRGVPEFSFATLYVAAPQGSPLARELTRTLEGSGSTLRVLEVAGHCAHLSHPELVIAAMRDFLGPPGTDIGT